MSGQRFAASFASVSHVDSGDADTAAAPGFHNMHATPLCLQGIMSWRQLPRRRRSQVCLCHCHHFHILPVPMTDNRLSDHPTSPLVSSKQIPQALLLKPPRLAFCLLSPALDLTAHFPHCVIALQGCLMKWGAAPRNNPPPFSVTISGPLPLSCTVSPCLSLLNADLSFYSPAFLYCLLLYSFLTHMQQYSLCLPLSLSFSLSLTPPHPSLIPHCTY